MKFKRLSERREHSHESLRAKRKQVVDAVREGQSAPQVAAALGLNL